MGVCDSQEGNSDDESDYTEEDKSAKQADANRIKKFSEQQLEAELAAQKKQHEDAKQKEKASKQEVFLVMRMNEQVISISLMVSASVTVRDLTDEASAVFADEDKVFDVLPTIEGLLPLWPKAAAKPAAKLTSKSTAAGKHPAYASADDDMAQACNGSKRGSIRFLIVHDEDSEDGPPKDWLSKPAQFWTSEAVVKLQSKRPKYRVEDISNQARIAAELAKEKAELEADMAADRAKADEAARQEKLDKAKALEAAKSGKGGIGRPAGAAPTGRSANGAAVPPRAVPSAPDRAVPVQRTAAVSPRHSAAPVGDIDDLLGGASAPAVASSSGSTNLMDLLGSSQTGTVDSSTPAVEFDLLGGVSGIDDGFGAFDVWTNDSAFGGNLDQTRHRSESFPGGVEVFTFDMSASDHLPPLVLEARLANAPSVTPASFEAYWTSAKQMTRVNMELDEPVNPSRLVSVLQRAALHGIAFKEDKETGALHAYHMAEECHTKELLMLEVAVHSGRIVNANLKAAPSSPEMLNRFERHVRLILYQNFRVKK